MNRKILFKVSMLIVAVMFSWVAPYGVSSQTTIKVSSEVGLHTEAWKTDLKNLEQKLGIKVELEQFPFDKYRERLMLDYKSGSPSYDVNYLSYGWYRALVDGAHLYPLNHFDLKSLDLKDIPNIDLFYMGEKKELYYMPFMNEIAGILYRTDLFNDPTERKNFKAKYGYDLAPPKTFKQYRDVAEFFHRPPHLYGVSLMGKRGVFLTVHFMNRLWGLGGDILDKEMKPKLNTPEGIRALEDLKVMFRYANPAASTHLFHEAVTEFQHGRSAMIEIWSTVMLYAEDAKKSKVAGKVSFAPIPKDEAFIGKEVPYLYISWGFVISSMSKQKERAFDFIRYITSKESMVRTTPHGNIPARFSVLDNPDVLKAAPWMKTIKETMLRSKLTPIYPWIPEGVTISADYISLAVSQYLAGERGAQEALKEADEKIFKLLSEGGYYKK